jgi:hypothetical protein
VSKNTSEELDDDDDVDDDDEDVVGEYQLLLLIMNSFKCRSSSSLTEDRGESDLSDASSQTD